ncbi:hypothetical protein GQ54DRAFT_309968 [Martensiomyces pterosporus]|nr:hypothetical protein GQ54DRAFT_309968 [Martensiomyces pterosporus]
MKLVCISVLLSMASLSSGHYSCTPQEALDVLLSDNTTDILAAQMLIALQKGVDTLRVDLDRTDPNKLAEDIIGRYREDVPDMNAAKYAALFLGIGTLASAHQGCNVDKALDTLLGEVGIEQISEVLLHTIQRDIDVAINALNSTVPQRFADSIIQRYRALQGILAFAGVTIPHI